MSINAVHHACYYFLEIILISSFRLTANICKKKKPQTIYFLHLPCGFHEKRDNCGRSAILIESSYHSKSNFRISATKENREKET